MFKFRIADEHDAEDIASVMVQSYNIANNEEGKNTFLGEMKRGHIFIVAVSETKTIGIASWLIHGLPKHGLAELDRIAVMPDSIGSGVAKELFSFTIDEMKKYYIGNDSVLRKLYLYHFCILQTLHLQ